MDYYFLIFFGTISFLTTNSKYRYFYDTYRSLNYERYINTINTVKIKQTRETAKPCLSIRPSLPLPAEFINNHYFAFTGKRRYSDKIDNGVKSRDKRYIEQ